MAVRNPVNVFKADMQPVDKCCYAAVHPFTAPKEADINPVMQEFLKGYAHLYVRSTSSLRLPPPPPSFLFSDSSLRREVSAWYAQAKGLPPPRYPKEIGLFMKGNSDLHLYGVEVSVLSPDLLAPPPPPSPLSIRF